MFFGSAKNSRGRLLIASYVFATSHHCIKRTCGPNVHVCQPEVGGFRVLDGQIAERVDGEELGVLLDHVRYVHVGTELGRGAKLFEVGEVLGRKVVHDRHGSAM